MKKYETDKSFLARWAANELSEDELAEFMQTDAYKDFNRINEFAQQFKGPKIDKEAALLSTKAKMKRGKVKTLNKSFWFSVAASIAILISGYFLINSTKNYVTGIGEQLAIVLPDGSEVQLNANSSLKYKRFFWTNNRQLNLKGEAYFEVEKGSDFKVITNYGNVTVLGTKFNVKSRTHVFELNCYEGKVRFHQKDSENQKILTANDKIIIEKEVISELKTQFNKPNWMEGISLFKDRPLQDVLNELSSMYKISFKTDKIDTTQRFSGSFTHNNLENALKTTLTPMGIVYTLSEDKTIVSLQ
ncbi:FecR family protein [Tenacibaculum aiptasiae]|uniref:FecR family protein n=1 Tax=Tenacibaculum aiptasiae TaxID=426481 RepID=A0A7J5ALW8_9FLAO|nr:FecR family protein [Tenacibaculum aiptasiae]KAB1158523.1 FecR family protein [Tenacibaculum aiptasiae]